MTILRQQLLVMTVIVAFYHQQHLTDGHVTISGSVVLETPWADFQMSRAPTKYKHMKQNIKNSLEKQFEDDPNFWNLSITQLREDHATKQSTLEGNLAAEFTLHLQSHSVTGIGRLRDAVTLGHLEHIPVKKKSLYLKGFLLNKIPNDYNVWPSGSYGFPKPKSGCPGNEWKEGFRYHDSENFNNINNQSRTYDLSGNVTTHGIKQEFCMHVGDDRKSITTPRPWPMGKYCIYKHGKSCPQGLHEGWMYWDDENTILDYPNAYGGVVPDGVYGSNTLIYYCCDSRGKTSTPILLPYAKPFFLFPFGSKECQRVHQYEVSSEYIVFDDEDQVNKNAHSVISPYGTTEDFYNTKLYFCYYKPIPCREESKQNPACYAHFLSTNKSNDGISMMITSTNHTVVPPARRRRHRAFAVGSGIGLMLMSWTAFVVVLQRINTTKRRHSYAVYYY